MDKLLKIKDLSYRVRGQVILKNIDLSLKRGEVLGIMGDSGSGKSTLGRILMGLIKDYSGDISFNKEYKNGLDLTLVPQNAQNTYNPSMKMGRQIIDSALLHRVLTEDEALTRAAFLLRELDLPEDIMGVYPHELSGGMKQRAAIASALITSPEILVLDEATSGLDRENKKRVLSLLESVREETGIILISHDMDVVRSFTDRILILNKGNILEWGRTEDVLAQPLHPYVKTLVSSEVGNLSGEISPVERLRDTPHDTPCPFVSHCREAMNICMRREPCRWHDEDGRGTACWLYYKEEK